MKNRVPKDAVAGGAEPIRHHISSAIRMMMGIGTPSNQSRRAGMLIS